MKKELIKGILAISCILWTGAMGFICYYANMDLNYIEKYSDLGVYEFYPEKVLYNKVKHNGVTKDRHYYVEYINSNTSHKWKRKAISKLTAHSIVDEGKVETRRIIDFSDNYTTISAETTAEEYILSRKNRRRITMYGSIFLGILSLIIGIVLFRKFIKSIKDLNKDLQQTNNNI